VSSDPLDRITAGLEQARRERDELLSRADRERVDNQHLQHRLTMSETNNRELLDRIAALQSRVDLAEQRVKAHKRAIRDHAGRT
jgi:uncharacterized protein involved in exopolysaccharide biosynthesis